MPNDTHNISSPNNQDERARKTDMFERIIRQNRITADIIALFTDTDKFDEKLKEYKRIFSAYHNIKNATLYIYDDNNAALRITAHDPDVKRSFFIPEIINLNLNKGFSDLLQKEELFGTEKVAAQEIVLSQRYDWNNHPEIRIMPARLTDKLLAIWIIELEKTKSLDDFDISFFKTIGVLTAQIFKRNLDVNSLKAAYTMADKANKIKSAFLANMSQEIRTPVNSIVGFSDLLADPDLTIDQREEFINLITQSARSLVKIFDNILDASKIDAEQLNLKVEYTPWSILYKELSTESGRYATNRNIQFIIEQPENINGLQLKTDAYRFKQVLINVIENAFKYTESGTVTLGYKFDKNENLLIYVKDTGIGISDDIKDNIFEFFNQRDDNYTRQSGSTGLGLALAYKITQLLSGKMWFETEKDKGTTFYTQFPKSILKIGGSSKTSAEMDLPNLKGKTILIAEDVEINYMLISELLSPTKVTLIWAKNGAEAIKAFQAKKPDLVLMDLQMPIMNGYEAIKAIRKLDKNIPIITQTAFVMNSEKEHSIEVGANDFIAKPIKPKELISVILRHLF
ncbi:MAG: response regulator [Salinivirgaceae bacterium]|nr:response regulator [Salinivirgaceae bacterium]